MTDPSKTQPSRIPDSEAIFEVIQKARYCHLSCCLENEPYLVPIAYGYDGENIYFHTGLGGKKIAILNENPLVSLAFEINVKVLPREDKACGWNFSYQSVILDGTAEELTTPEEKEYGLAQIMDHYSSKKWAFPSKKVAKTRIWKITPSAITYKKSP